MVTMTNIQIKNTVAYARAVVPCTYIRRKMTYYHGSGEWGVKGLSIEQLNALNAQTKKIVYSALYKLCEYEQTNLSVDDVYDAIDNLQRRQDEHEQLTIGKVLQLNYCVTALSLHHGIAVNFDAEYQYCLFKHNENLVYHMHLYKKFSEVKQAFISEALNMK